MKYILAMTMRDKIDNDYKNALKSKDKNKISTYRLILSGIKDLDINNRSSPNKKDTDDEDIKKLLKKMIKQRSESIEIYKNNNFEISNYRIPKKNVKIRILRSRAIGSYRKLCINEDVEVPRHRILGTSK